MNVKPLPTKKKFSLADVTSGRLNLPRRILGFGLEGVGKSTFASHAPKPVFLCPENGTPHLDVKRLPSPETWDDVLEIISLLEGDSPYETLVIDPVNWLELLCWARVVGGSGSKPTEDTADALQKHGGGFGKGIEATLGHWRTFVAALERVWKNKHHVLMLGHAHSKTFNDPTGVSYDRYELQMNQKGAGVLKQWCDDVLFMRNEVLRKQEGSKVVAVATGERIIHTTWDRAWDAKNRAALPDELPLSWDEYWTRVEASMTALPKLKTDIGALLEQISDAEVTRKAKAEVVKAGSDASRLTEIANALRTKLANNT